MTVRLMLLVAGALWMAACSDTDRAPESGPVEPRASAISAPQDDAARMTPRSGPSIEHMHTHADQLDRLNAALAAGDLVAAGTPAYWLSRHETLAGLPAELHPYLERMRAEAGIVERATDLATARAAAARLEDSCEACHQASGN